MFCQSANRVEYSAIVSSSLHIRLHSIGLRIEFIRCRRHFYVQCIRVCWTSGTRNALRVYKPANVQQCQKTPNIDFCCQPRDSELQDNPSTEQNPVSRIFKLKSHFTIIQTTRYKRILTTSQGGTRSHILYTVYEICFLSETHPRRFKN